MTQKKSHRKIYILGGIAVAVMFLFCFAMVPLYSIICKKAGLNTALNKDLVTQVAPLSENDKPDLSRDVTVQFVAIQNMGLPWDFYPQVKSVKVHPGESTKVMFYAKNTTDKPMTVQAIPSITPADANGHFHKIECFCFQNQKLAARADKEMPLVFTISKDLPSHVHVITLAYTLFDVTAQAAKKDKKS